MKILFSTIICLLINAVVHAQSLQVKANDGIVFKVTAESKSLYSPQDCDLYVNRTVFADGRIEVEDCRSTKIAENGKKIPVKIENRISAERLSRFMKFVEESGLLEAKSEYSGKADYTEGNTLTTIVYQNRDITKKVVIRNFDPYDMSIPCFLVRVISWLP